MSVEVKNVIMAEIDLTLFVKVFPIFLVLFCLSLLLGKWRKQKVFNRQVGQKEICCKNCKTKLPRIRVPCDWKQALHGGWICKKCGSRLDAKGSPINIQKTSP